MTMTPCNGNETLAITKTYHRTASKITDLFDAMENKDFKVNVETMQPGLVKVENVVTLAEKLHQFTSE